MAWRYSRHDTTFEDTEHSARNQKALKAVYESCAQRNESESDYKHGKVILGSDLLEQDITGHFNEHVDDVED